jgi:hypothetical protein
MHPALLRAFQRHQEHDLEASRFGGPHNYETNYLLLLHR